MKQDRPRLTDPEEMAIIRNMYFDDHNPLNSDLDTKEALEREEAKFRNRQQSSQ